MNPEISVKFPKGREAPRRDSRACGRSVYLPSKVYSFNQNQFISFIGLQSHPGEADQLEMISLYPELEVAVGLASWPGRTGDGKQGEGKVSMPGLVARERIPGVKSPPLATIAGPTCQFDRLRETHLGMSWRT